MASSVFRWNRSSTVITSAGCYLLAHAVREQTRISWPNEQDGRSQHRPQTRMTGEDERGKIDKPGAILF
jgi:hypothetical protein